MEDDDIISYISDYHFYRKLLTIIGEWLYIMDAQLKIVFANDAAMNQVFCGLNPIGRTIFELFPQVTETSSFSARAFRSGVAYKNLVQVYVDINGNKRASLASTYPIKKQGRIIGVCEFGEDITGIVNLSDTLVKNESRQRMLSRRHGDIKGRDMYYTIDSIIGNSNAIKQLKANIMRAAASNSHLFIYGETGAGKEMVAQAVYMLSKDYKQHPFIAQNCAAIPESLLESILFGTVKGAFTGAESRPGLFESADGGIMYLDEINSMPITLQAKLLRVIEEGKVTRVGSVKEIPCRFRLISSTNAPPESLLANKTLRPDLYYRLNVLYIKVPPLRDRVEDIPLLVDCFINEVNSQLNKQVVGLSHAALDKIMQYDWPGNVRELRNVVERAVNAASSDIIDAEGIDLLSYVQPRIIGAGVFDDGREASGAAPPKRIILREELRRVEKELIEEALGRHRGNISRAARELDVPQSTLYNKLEKLDLLAHARNLNQKPIDFSIDLSKK